jgi:hypothetical protein
VTHPDHDRLILEDLKQQLDRMELVDQDEVEDAREQITTMVETLLRRLASSRVLRGSGSAGAPQDDGGRDA